MCAPPSCATESSPYSFSTRAYSLSARSAPTVARSRGPSGVPAGSSLPEELVEEQPPDRLGRARVAREQRALDGFRKIAQREDGSIGVREVRRERARFVGRERLGDGDGGSHGGRVFYLA